MRGIMESFMAMEPSDHEDRVNEQIGESGKVKCLKTSDQFYLDTQDQKNFRPDLGYNISLKYSPAMLFLF